VQYTNRNISSETIIKKYLLWLFEISQPLNKNVSYVQMESGAILTQKSRICLSSGDKHQHVTDADRQTEHKTLIATQHVSYADE